MKHTLTLAAGALALVFAGAVDARAQTFNFKDNIFVNVNFGAQTKSQAESSHLGLELYLETGSVDYTRTVKGGSFVDITAGATPLGRFGLAVNFMRRTAASDGALVASIPDPFFYDANHALSGDIPKMAHQETWFALLFAYRVPSPVKSLEIMALAGPALCLVKHEAVTGITVSPGGSQVSAELALLSRDLLGFQAGADVSYRFTRLIGAGGYIRYNAASGHLGPTVKIDLGGLQFGGGLRLRF